MKELTQADECHIKTRIAWSVLLGAFVSGTLATALYRTCSWLTELRTHKPYFCEMAWEHPPWILFSSLAAAPALILTWHWRSVNRRREIRIANQVQLSTRFAEAVRLLSESVKLEARIGAVFALEHLAREGGDALHRTVIETLSAFVREHSPRKPESPAAVPRTDIACALAVLGRIGPSKEVASDLAGTHLTQVKLAGANLRGANLRGANLRGADLTRAELDKSVLLDADLRSAILAGAYLDDASLAGADCRGADFSYATFGTAQLHSADMRDANLSSVSLHHAEFRETDLGELEELAYINKDRSRGIVLSHAVMRGARYTSSTTFPDDFDPKAHAMVLVDEFGGPIDPLPGAPVDDSGDSGEPRD